MKIKLAAFVDDVRNKMGNVVASKNKGGAYFRKRVVPYNPKSTAQVAQRARITTFSQAWGSLTDAQRILWNTASLLWGKLGIFGDHLVISGENLFIRLNTNLSLISVAQINTPPSKTSVAALSTLTCTQVHAGATSVAFSVSPAPAGSTYILEATKPMSAGRFFVKSQYRIIATFAAGQTTPYTATTAYANVFGGPGAAGQKVFFRVRPINSTTGQPGAVLTAIAIVS